jgi:8-oxo-dGTP pyrophosphatase MutT (NUDIX family)
MDVAAFTQSLQDVLDPFDRDQIRIDGFRRAAVLVPLLVTKRGVDLYLTRRTDDVETHKGQISFPGGGVEEADRTIIETALRESEEEIGLKPECVRAVGLIDDHVTPTGFIITPVVGVIADAPILQPNPVEVAEVLQIPLAFFAETKRVRQEKRLFRGRIHDVWFYDTGTHVIWGATAAMIRVLLRRLKMVG